MIPFADARFDRTPEMLVLKAANVCLVNPWVRMPVWKIVFCFTQNNDSVCSRCDADAY